MPATRKIQSNVQNQDLAQLKSLFGNTERAAFASRKEKEPAGMKIDSVSSASENGSGGKGEEERTGAADITDSAEASENNENKRETSDTTVGIRMSTAKKKEMKTYFIQHGITMSQGVLDAFSLLRKLEDKGLIAYRNGSLEINNA